jgi:hypothetical protein
VVRLRDIEEARAAGGRVQRRVVFLAGRVRTSFWRRRYVVVKRRVTRCDWCFRVDHRYFAAHCQFIDCLVGWVVAETRDELTQLAFFVGIFSIRRLEWADSGGPAGFRYGLECWHSGGSWGRFRRSLRRLLLNQRAAGNWGFG